MNWDAGYPTVIYYLHAGNHAKSFVLNSYVFAFDTCRMLAAVYLHALEPLPAFLITTDR